MRGQLKSMGEKGREREREEEKMIFGEMRCEVCGKGGARRCKGCGSVGYCGVRCQGEGWKGHRRFCGRGKKREGEEVGRVGVPYETI